MWGVNVRLKTEKIAGCRSRGIKNGHFCTLKEHIFADISRKLRIETIIELFRDDGSRINGECDRGTLF